MEKSAPLVRIVQVILSITIIGIATPDLMAQNDNGRTAGTDMLQNQEMQTFHSYHEVGYDQILRPQFHFSSLKGWHNDPNGMVWYDGEYHLYFQHNPKDTKWGNMTWGHAVSSDMVHWKQLPHAILPYGGGTIFSGTAVVDHQNALGKQTGNIKTIVAFFSFAKQPFYQAAAYSTDRGRTFTLVNEGGPVVPNQGFNKGERDPKVFWHKASEKWVMVLWVKRGKKDGTADEKLGKVRFFTSENMVDWEVASDFNREWVFECMDFVELPVDGNPDNKKWLLYDASFDYEIGDFDGKTFTTDKKVYLGDYGTDFYAAQTFNNSPDERTVLIGWMQEGKNSVFQEAGMPFNQQMAFPTTMELKTTDDGIQLFRWPVKEIERLYTRSNKFNKLTVKKLSKKLSSIEAELIDLSIEFDASHSMTLTIRGLPVSYDSKREEFSFGSSQMAAPAIDGKIRLRVLLDRASIELFINDGATVSTNYAVPVTDDRSISISADENMKINSFIINEMKSSWESDVK
jgi:sucrose-6-phosphate hydrolase SacC (GH32 family)